jgi:hypothetical protein
MLMLHSSYWLNTIDDEEPIPGFIYWIEVHHVADWFLIRLVKPEAIELMDTSFPKAMAPRLWLLNRSIGIE